MQIKDIMTPNPRFLLTTATLSEAAKKMRELDTGFIPVGDQSTNKLVGTITDRDIVIEAVANKKDLDTPLKDIMHKGVCYCYETDDVKEATKCMKDKQIRRLIVLDKDKNLTGIVSLGDIALHCQDELTGDTLEEISKH
ncbi:CBS domain-containing protein [Legionella impletisoli]|uniref:CBS domain-containing protein n=1 Tax=Legionella impletisoli TaxID=343510 RepID=A0A917NA67_9GAMM|nr:CBS domain-containing protein [Legionella impletisoli]GGI81779.1 CBS domain-containing protein [Legionella impletisoli]